MLDMFQVMNKKNKNKKNNGGKTRTKVQRNTAYHFNTHQFIQGWLFPKFAWLSFYTKSNYFSFFLDASSKTWSSFIYFPPSIHALFLYPGKKDIWRFYKNLGKDNSSALTNWITLHCSLLNDEMRDVWFVGCAVCGRLQNTSYYTKNFSWFCFMWVI